MGADMSKPDRKKLQSKVHKLAKNSSGWQKIAEEFMAATPQGTEIKCKDKKVVDACFKIFEDRLGKGEAEDIMLMLMVFRRLVMAKGVYALLPKYSLKPFVEAAKSKDTKMILSALQLIKLMVEAPPTSAAGAPKNESAIKDAFFDAQGYVMLAKLLNSYARRSRATEVVLAILDILHSTLVTHLNSTEPVTRLKVLKLIQGECEETLFQLTHAQVADLRVHAAAMVKTFLTGLDEVEIDGIQSRALDHGVLLWQFSFAMSASKAMGSQINVSRELVRLLCDAHAPSLSALERMLPHPLVAILHGISNGENPSTPTTPTSKKIRSTTVSSATGRGTKITRGNSSDSPLMHSGRYNWTGFWRVLDDTAESPTLRWNDKCREELRAALIREAEVLEKLRKQGLAKAWNWESFVVEYGSLSSYVYVRPYYLDLLMPCIPEPSFEFSESPRQYIAQLYDRSIIEDYPPHKFLLLQSLRGVYERCRDDLNDLNIVPYLVWLLKPAHYHPLWRQQVLILLKSMFLEESYQIKFIDAGGLDVLLYHLSLCHSDQRASESGQRLHPSSLGKFSLLLLDTLLARPVAVKRLVSPQSLQYIIQALLVDSFEIVDLTVKLLLKLLDKRPEVGPTLYRTGVFSFLMAGIAHGCTPTIVRFLKTYHNEQLVAPDRPEPVPLSHKRSSRTLQDSYLAYFLPSAVLQLLDEMDEPSFSQLLQCKSTRSNVIWGEHHLALLNEQVNAQLSDFRQAIARDPTLLYSWEEPKRVVYPDLEEEMVVSGVYLSCMISDPKCPVDQPPAFIRNLIDTMDPARSQSSLHTVLTAQSAALKRFPKDPNFTSYPKFDAISRILDTDLNTSSGRMLVSAALTLTRDLLRLHDSRANLKSALDKGVLQHVADLLPKTLAKLEEGGTKLAAQAVGLIDLFADHNNFVVAISLHPTLVQTLVLYLRPTVLDLSEGLAMSVLSCTNKMAKSRALATRLIEAGAVLYLLQLLLVYPIPEAKKRSKKKKTSMPRSRSKKRMEKEPVVDEDEGTSSEASDHSPSSSVRRGVTREVALEGLRALGELAAASTTTLQPFLSAVVTPAHYKSLVESPDSDLLDRLRRVHESPTLIWNEAMKNELKDYLEEEIKKLGEDVSRRWVARNAHFAYKSLEKEIEVCGVYLRPYAALPNYELNAPQDFLVALLDRVDDLVDRFSTANDPPARAALVQEAKQLAEALRNATVSRKKDNDDTDDELGEREGLIALLATLPQAQSLFALLKHKDDPSNPSSLSPAILPLLRVIQAMSQQSTCTGVLLKHVAVLHWLLQACSNSPRVQVVTFSILTNLALRSSQAVKYLRDSGMCVSMMALFCGSPNKEIRSKAARVIGALVKDPVHGKDMKELYMLFFTPQFSANLDSAFDNPEELVDLYDADNETPFMFWNNETRKDLVNALIKELNPIIRSLVAPPSDDPQEYAWDYANFPKRYERTAEKREKKVGGYFVRFFNNDPAKYVDELSHQEFMQALIEHLGQNDPMDRTCWEAVLNLLHHRSKLKKHPVIIHHLPLIVSVVSGKFAEKPGVTFDEDAQHAALDVLLLLGRKKDIAKRMGPRLVAAVLPYLQIPPPDEEDDHDSSPDASKRPAVLLFLQDYIEAGGQNVKLLLAGGAPLFLMNMVLSGRCEEEREEACSALIGMLGDQEVGANVADTLGLFVPKSLKELMAKTPPIPPDELLRTLDADHQAEGRVWNAATRATIARYMANEVTRLAEFQDSWSGTERWNKASLRELYGRLRWK